MKHQCTDERNDKCSPDHCVVIGCPLKKWNCDNCGSDPDAHEFKRIEVDLANTEGASPVAWYCPTCAPELKDAPSGLVWQIIEVVGASSP